MWQWPKTTNQICKVPFGGRAHMSKYARYTPQGALPSTHTHAHTLLENAFCTDTYEYNIIFIYDDDDDIFGRKFLSMAYIYIRM